MEVVKAGSFHPEIVYEKKADDIAFGDELEIIDDGETAERSLDSEVSESSLDRETAERSLDSGVSEGSLNRETDEKILDRETAERSLDNEVSEGSLKGRETSKAEKFNLNRGAPREFGAVELTQFRDLQVLKFDSISAVLETYYAEKNDSTRIRQRSADLRKVVSTLLERAVKKYDLQRKQLKDTEKKDRYRIYGEMLNTYGYSAEPEAREFTCLNYYTNEEITIPLDPTLSALENAQKYFSKYQKLKRTEEALQDQLKITKEDVDYLESVQAALEMAGNEADLFEIRRELSDGGYVKKRSVKKGAGKPETGKPYHYRSSDGYDIYVGRNNYQNDNLTFRFAGGNDWWFHAKKFAGSHVILRVGDGDPDSLPDRAFNEAGALAAYYSKGRGQAKVEIDYVKKKEVKKPAGSKPGFVVYYTNYSMAIDSDISGLKLLE
ncbi:MAG: NFACT family protein [Lachnospiraceae bacterium]|nr:NFACT family protein [Lachnospiraceae bacterium]